MSLSTNDFKIDYNTLLEDVVNDFYIPCLSNATKYCRVTAYFTAGVLLKLSIGLIELAKNKGKIQMIVSHKLDQEEYEAIKNGYSESAEKSLDSNFDELIDFEQKHDRFGMLSYLIQNKILEIKVAYIVKENSANGILHTKNGIFIDRQDNMVFFTGSANDTFNAFESNYEDIAVFCSWNNIVDEARCYTNYDKFNRLWENKEEGVLTLPFPEVIKNKLMKYHDSNKNYDSLDKELIEYLFKRRLRKEVIEIGKSKFPLHDYQNEAIKAWEDNDYFGIYDMATGTGKTFTALGSISYLYRKINRLFVVICVPYTHLVEQWFDEADSFNIPSLKCYDSFIKFKSKLKNKVDRFRNKKSDFECIIITNGSFPNEEIQKMLKKISSEVLFIVDEAHNFGAPKISKTLEVQYKYRLGLSATINRHNDQEGTELLKSYFGKIVYSYSLQKAIEEKKLTPYKYFPIVNYLDAAEYDRYDELTRRINSFHYDRKTQSMPSSLKTLYIKRARIVAETKQKVSNLLKIIRGNSLVNEKNMLVYCGAVTYEEDVFDKDDVRQIHQIINTLQFDLDMIVNKFTADESSEERKDIIESFVNQDINAIVAIKCLDEGVNIPAISRAFILASSTNPKEYIQRRGRVLRKHPGKKYSEIYDFITLPRDLNSVSTISEMHRKVDLSLIRREFDRIKCFAELAMNTTESFKLMSDIEEAYELNIIREVDIYE